MDELQAALQKIIEAVPTRMALSAPRAGVAFRRASVTPLPAGWQVEKLTDTQAFHQNLPGGELAGALEQLLRQEFTQLTAVAGGREWQLRLTKKGKLLARQGPVQGGAVPAAAEAGAAAHTHDRQKRRLLPEGVAVAPLVDIGVMTAEGRVVAAKRDKYRQINRFIELVDDVLRQGEAPKTLRVVDFGCGKSYLTFLLYHYLTVTRGMEAHVTGLDLKAEVVEKCNAAAKKYGYRNLHFAVGDIAGHQSEAPVDMVVSLHACDTATDLALAKAVQWGAGMIFSVPCCQHELNGQMKSDELSILTRYGIVQERTAALMTDAVRANLLTACGYKTQLLEFVDMEHTPKNIMIRAVKRNVSRPARQKALAEVWQLCNAFDLSPTLLELLGRQAVIDCE